MPRHPAVQPEPVGRHYEPRRGPVLAAITSSRGPMTANRRCADHGQNARRPARQSLGRHEVRIDGAAARIGTRNLPRELADRDGHHRGRHGSEPYAVSGPVYLAGPTKLKNGAEGPFGLDIVVPAKAGPFNLGTVVVQAGDRGQRRNGRPDDRQRTAAPEPRRRAVPDQGRRGQGRPSPNSRSTRRTAKTRATSKRPSAANGHRIRNGWFGDRQRTVRPDRLRRAAVTAPTFEGTVNARTQNEPLTASGSPCAQRASR